jgi:flagellar assembly protein FliH
LVEQNSSSGIHHSLSPKSHSSLDWSPISFPTVDSICHVSEKEPKTAVVDTIPHVKGWQPGEFEAIPVIRRFANRETINRDSLQEYVDQILKQAQTKAVEIIRNAESRADEIVVSADQMSKNSLHQAEAQIAEFTHQGYLDGISTANQETADLVQTARSIVEEVQIWRENIFSQAETMMLRLVIEIAQTIFGDGLPLDPDTLGQAFSRALSQAKTLGDLRIYVHPEDATRLSLHWLQKQTAFSGQRIELIPSDIIKRGGCFLDGQFGSIDARVETQLQSTKNALLLTLGVAEAEEK